MKKKLQLKSFWVSWSLVDLGSVLKCWVIDKYLLP